jgi:hypothetical protein
LVSTSAVWRGAVVGVDGAHAADEGRHLERDQRQQVGASSSNCTASNSASPPRQLRNPSALGSSRRRSPRQSAPARRRVRPGATDRDVVAGVLRRVLDGGASAQDDEVGER